MQCIQKACPLCGSDVTGAEDCKYFCKNCNMLFKKEHLTPEFTSER